MNPVHGAEALERVCRECGCSQTNACWHDDRGPCAWAEKDLCTACTPEGKADKSWSRPFEETS